MDGDDVPFLLVTASTEADARPVNIRRRRCRALDATLQLTLVSSSNHQSSLEGMELKIGTWRARAQMKLATKRKAPAVKVQDEIMVGQMTVCRGC
jgi:hypothetical protein